MNSSQISLKQIVWFIIIMLLIQVPALLLPDKIFIIIIASISLVFIFNVMVRKKAKFKVYFTSRLNFTSSKFNSIKSDDMSKDILFEKYKEILTESNYFIFHENKKNGELYATIKMNWQTWGGNIYIIFNEVNNGTEIVFKSSLLFGFDLWNEQRKVYKCLITVFDDSLTI